MGTSVSPCHPVQHSPYPHQHLGLLYPRQRVVKLLLLPHVRPARRTASQITKTEKTARRSVGKLGEATINEQSMSNQ